MKKQCVTHNVIIGLSITTEHQTSTAGLMELLSKVIFLGNIPVGVLLLNEDEGVMGGVTGGVRLPLLWRGGVATLMRERPPISESDSFG